MTKGNLCRWVSFAVTHVGNIRKMNEDAVVDNDAAGVWAVADGMGGHSAGDVASSKVAEELLKIGLHDTLGKMVDAVEDAIIATHQYLVQLANERGPEHIIGTTVAGVIGFGCRAVVFWIGDSRVYLFRNGVLQLLSEDHTAVEELVQMGIILREDAHTHADKNVINRAVGADERSCLDLDDLSVAVGDIFLICSDGLNKELSDKEIEAVLAGGGSLQELGSKLMDMGLARDARDNTSIVLVRAAG
jgi:serine/threonine protein phosphatase PrpC